MATSHLHLRKLPSSLLLLFAPIPAIARWFMGVAYFEIYPTKQYLSPMSVEFDLDSIISHKEYCLDSYMKFSAAKALYETHTLSPD